VTESTLIDSVHGQTAWSAARSHSDDKAVLLAQTCAAINGSTTREAERIGALTSPHSLKIEALPSGQLHVIDLWVGSRPAAKAVAAILVTDGYVSWRALQGGAEASFFATRSSLTLVRLDEHAFTINLYWPSAALACRLPNGMLPTQHDWEVVDLPKSLWPLYFAFRPVRLVRDRLGGRSDAGGYLGPILSTPESLIGPLLELAGVDADEHFLDLGCGDGRLVVEAAARFGCKATGVENDPDLVKRARDRATAAGVDDLVDIVESDGRTFDASAATVAILFVPVGELQAAVDHLRAQGFAGRIVAHEQEALPDSVRPTESHLLIADEAITVAHVFD
jgi:hypothetical protein